MALPENAEKITEDIYRDSSGEIRLRAPKRPILWWGEFNTVNAIGASYVLFAIWALIVFAGEIIKYNVLYNLRFSRDKIPPVFLLSVFLGVCSLILFFFGLSILFRCRWLSFMIPREDIKTCYEFNYVRYSDLRTSPNILEEIFGNKIFMVLLFPAVTIGTYYIFRPVQLMFVSRISDPLKLAPIVSAIAIPSLVGIFIVFLIGFCRGKNTSRLELIFITVVIIIFGITDGCFFITDNMRWFPMKPVHEIYYYYRIDYLIWFLTTLVLCYPPLEFIRFLRSDRAKAWCGVGEYTPPWEKQLTAAGLSIPEAEEKE